MKSWHVAVCVGGVAAVAILAAIGTGAPAGLAVAGCAVMMGAMVWMMFGSRG